MTELVDEAKRSISVFENFPFQLFLSIVGIAISVGGFAQVFFLEGVGPKKVISLATALTLVCVLFGTAAISLHRHWPAMEIVVQAN